MASPAAANAQLDEGNGSDVDGTAEASSSGDAQAIFRSGVKTFARAKEMSSSPQRKALLQNARRSVVDAARLEPTNREMRAVLEQIKEVLRQENQTRGGKSLLDGLYDDKDEPAATVSPPVVVCSVCGREGHTSCGNAVWVAQRAQWLCLPEEQVGAVPPGFEDNGTLIDICIARAAARAETAAVSDPRPSRSQGPYIDLDDLSSDELEMLEDCLDAVDKPYPALKRRLALPQAVLCAEEMWGLPKT